MEKMTLLKFLVGAGVGSRRVCFGLIRDNVIRVNTEIVNQPMHEITKKDKIYHEEQILRFHKDKFEPVYIMMNKPKCTISSVKDEDGKTSILKLIKNKNLQKKHLFPVGRLDYLTEGLIYITNDGHFANHLLRAKNEIRKYYYVELKGTIRDNHVERIRKGLHVDDLVYNVDSIRVISAGQKTSKVVVVLIEGKNREIRNIFLTLKYKIKFLKRIQIGSTKLDPKLKPGQYKLVSGAVLYKSLGVPLSGK